MHPAAQPRSIGEPKVQVDAQLEVQPNLVPDPVAAPAV